MKVNDRVIVSAAVTGDGEEHHGRIIDIYDFARETFVEVQFDHITPDGRTGTVINNLGLLRKENYA